jgi:hypothetical protein
MTTIVYNMPMINMISQALADGRLIALITKLTTYV